jgi:putative two-component system response regulator
MGSGLTESLESLLDQTRGGGDPELKIAINRLATEVKRRFEKGSDSSYDFLISTLRALSRVKGTVHADTRMTALFDCGAFFLYNRHDREALESATHLEDLALRMQDKHWARKATMLKGIVYAHIGDFGEAVLHYSKALELARELQQTVAQISVLSNLGTAFNYAGLYREAIPCFENAIFLYSKDSEGRPYAASVYCNLAQSHLALGEFRQGFGAISKCLSLSDEPTDAISRFNQSVRELTFVQLALELGRLSLAREHAQRCLHHSRLSGLRKALFIGDLAIGLCEIHGGNVTKGLALLEKAMEASGEKGTSEHADALSALVKAYDHTYQPEKALTRLSELLATLRSRREQSLSALMTINPIEDRRFAVESEDRDLKELTIREAKLRTYVAERDAVNAHLGMLERLAITADLKDDISGEHGYRVGRLAFLVAQALSWNAEASAALELAARTHDLGKIAMPDRILLSSKELQEAERHFMSTHTTIGAELLGKSNIPQLRMAEEIARHHHEWWNGEGYPSKLKGKRIPIHARIVALADVFDALTHGRPFSPPWPIDKALDDIRARKGTQFDPELTDLFLALIEKLRKEHEDLDEYLGRAGKNSPFLQARNRIRQMLAEEREHEKMATVEGNQTRH